MYISAKEHARLRYRSRAIDRIVELIWPATPGVDSPFDPGNHHAQLTEVATRVLVHELATFHTEREKRFADAGRQEAACPSKKSTTI